MCSIFLLFCIYLFQLFLFLIQVYDKTFFTFSLWHNFSHTEKNSENSTKNTHALLLCCMVFFFLSLSSAFQHLWMKNVFVFLEVIQKFFQIEYFIFSKWLWYLAYKLGIKYSCINKFFSSSKTLKCPSLKSKRVLMGEFFHPLSLYLNHTLFILLCSCVSISFYQDLKALGDFILLHIKSIVHKLS